MVLKLNCDQCESGLTYLREDVKLRTAEKSAMLHKLFQLPVAQSLQLCAVHRDKHFTHKLLCLFSDGVQWVPFRQLQNVNAVILAESVHQVMSSEA